MPAVIVELDEAVFHTGDKGLVLKNVWVPALRSQTSSLTQRRAEIANDIPALDARSVFFDLVERVVLILQVGTIEHHQHHQQSLVRLRPNSAQRDSALTTCMSVSWNR